MLLKHFTAPGSGRNVAFNGSGSEVGLLGNVTIREMRGLIADYEKIRLAEFWQTVLLTPSKKGRWIKAFDTTGNNTQFRSFSVGAVQAMTGKTLNGQALVNYVRKLPLHVQKRIVTAVKPTSFADLLKLTASRHVAVIGPNLHARLSEAGTPRKFTSKLMQELKQGAGRGHTPRIAEFLTLIWSRGKFVFPADLLRWSSKAYKYRTFFDSLYSSKGKLLASLVRIPKSTILTSDLAFTCLCSFVVATNIESTKDLSPEMLDYAEECFIARVDEQRGDSPDDSKFQLMRYRIRAAIMRLRQVFNRSNPTHAIAITQPPRGTSGKSRGRISPDFAWLKEERPDLHVWATWFAKFVKSLRNGRVQAPILKLNSFGDFLCCLQAPPLSPFEITRQHIENPENPSNRTFLGFLAERFPEKDPKVKNDITAKMRRFFDWVKDQLLLEGHPKATTFQNPFSKSDNFGKRINPSVTHRQRLENYILVTMKEILVEDDFAFPKSMDWTHVDVLDNTTNMRTHVWDPTLTVCMYVLLDTPLRSHQARWLDSGELDETIYDESKNTNVPNPSKFAKRGRKEGALRLKDDFLETDSWMTLWVNTNKTARYDSKEIGYPIPYISNSLRDLLVMQRAWQRRYLMPITKALPYITYQADVDEADRVCPNLPSIAPLFRSAAGADLLKPVSYHHLKRFYVALLEETQKRIEQKYGRKVELVRIVNKKRKWAVDLHTLRVSGITALIEAGVPLEVVSQFVAGHHTLVMTLHYLKYSPRKLKAFLQAAHEKMRDDMDFAGSEEFQTNLEDFAPYLLGQDGAGTGAGFIAIKEANGLMSINTEGICPGTSCDSGGPRVHATKFGPVPGGQRCGLCRYWITGPAHLLGQVAAVNNLAYKIRKKGLEIAKLNDARLDAEDAGNKREARELVDKVELLGREIRIDVDEWFARYRYAERSIQLMDDYLATRARVASKGKRVPALTASKPGDLKVTLESAHEFQLLNEITQMTDFTTGFRNEEAELEKKVTLSTLMMENGVRPFLLSLTSEQSHEAGNLLSSLITSQIKGQELDEVLHGHRPLSDYPHLSKAISLMEQQSRSTPAEAKRLSSKLDILFETTESKANTNEVEELL
jgi:hypothetical protein